MKPEHDRPAHFLGEASGTTALQGGKTFKEPLPAACERHR